MNNRWGFIILAILIIAFMTFLAGCSENPLDKGEPVPEGGISTIYLANQTNGVIVFNVAAGTAESVITFEGATRLYGVALSPDKNKLYALSDELFDISATGEIFSYNLETGARSSLAVTFAMSEESFGNYILGFSSDGQKMYVPMRKKVGIYTINTSPFSIDKVGSIEEICNGLTGGVVPGDGHVYFGNNLLGKVYMYDIAQNTVEASVTLPLAPTDITWYMRLNPYDNLIYVPSVFGDEVYRVAYNPSFSLVGGGAGYATETGGIPIDIGFSNNGYAYTALYGAEKVEVFNYTTGTLVKKISLSAIGPNNVIIDDTRRLAYVNGYDAPQIAVINTADNSVVTTIVIPSRTDQTAYK